MKLSEQTKRSNRIAYLKNYISNLENRGGYLLHFEQKKLTEYKTELQELEDGNNE